MADLQRARLIPVSGIGSEQEAETRATSALLAVLTIVRDFSSHLLAPLGASTAKKASVEAFTEPPYKYNGKASRPDGLILVSYGSKKWAALVEVKTGEAILDAEQVNTYIDIAREQGIDAVITISNEIPPGPGVHPTVGLKTRSNSKVKVHHMSWTSILSSAVMVKVHTGVDDPEQAWILGELIRYLEHPKSGAMSFDDMGSDWVAVRNAIKDGVIAVRTAGLTEVVGRWEQLMRFAALRLGSEVGAEVQVVLSRAHQDAKARAQFLVDSVVGSGTLTGTLRVPNTAGDLEITADLRTRRLTIATTVTAAEDRGPVGQVTWILAQLPDAAPNTVIESWAKNGRSPMCMAQVALIRDDKTALLDPAKTMAVKFRLITRADMGTGRKAQANNSFIDSVLATIDTHYASVVQGITPWYPKAPKANKRATLEPGGDEDSTGRHASDPTSEATTPPDQVISRELKPPSTWAQSSRIEPLDSDAPEALVEAPEEAAGVELLRGENGGPTVHPSTEHQEPA
jgi:hypothetical protein